MPSSCEHRRSDSRGSQGKSQSEAAAPSRLALQPDGTPVELHQVLGNRQAQSRALMKTARRGGGLIELLKNRSVFVFVDADAGVANRNLQEASVEHRFYPYAATLARELDRVAQQIVEDLFDTHAIGEQLPVEGRLVLEGYGLDLGLLA